MNFEQWYEENAKYINPVDFKIWLSEAFDAGFLSVKQSDLSEINLNCKSVQARLATSWGYVKAEQVEQRSDSERMEPVAWIKDNKLQLDGLRTSLLFHADGWTPLYAAPVQQVDLTDGEIAKALGFNIMLVTTKELKDARAVIAAYKEKNKCFT